MVRPETFTGQAALVYVYDFSDIPITYNNPLSLLSSGEASENISNGARTCRDRSARTNVQRGIPLDTTFSVTPNRFLEEMVSVSGIDIIEAIDLTDAIERKQERAYAFSMLRSAANSERWYGELKEYLARYGVEVIKPFQPQNPELAAKAAVPMRQPYLYDLHASREELKRSAGSRSKRI